MSLHPLYKYSAVRRFFQSARTRRVDIAYVGDSNVYMDGYGEKPGWQTAYHARFGQYATGVMASSASGSYQVDSSSNSPGGDQPGQATIPASHAAYPFATGANPYKYLYFPAGTSSGFSYAAAFVNGPQSLEGRLRFAFDYATFATGSGQFQPVARYNGQLAYAAIGATIQTNTGVNGVASSYLDIAAGSRSSTPLIMQFQVHEGGGFNPPSVIQASGPFASFYNRTIFMDVNAGISVNTLFYAGGEPTRTAALNFQAMTQLQFNTWVANVVAHQDADPMLLVQIVEGGNDMSDTGHPTTPSVGPHPTASGTAAGVVDNHDAIVIRLRALWAGAGYDPANLFFLIGPYHPAEESRLQSKRQIDRAMEAYADGQYNVARASDSRISTSAYIRDRGWYLGTFGDDSHLNGSGHNPWCQMALDAILPPAAAVLRLTSGSTYYAVLFDAAGQPLDQVNRSFGPLADSLWANYALAGEELGTTGLFRFVLPAWVNRSTIFRGIIFTQGGGSPAKTDAQAAAIAAADFDGVRSILLDDAATDIKASIPTADVEAIRVKTDLITTEGLRYAGGYSNGVISIRRGDSYGTSSGQTLPIPKPEGASWPDLTDGWTVTFRSSLRETSGATGATSIAATAVVVDDENFRVDLTAAATAALDLGPGNPRGSRGGNAWSWEAEASKGSDRNTLISGTMTVAGDLG